ncbi:hypothetical protein ACL03H_23515 [Saccharopolyspora sp. MS10]|uniref:hypothetical protein n=1 Tax=Saccharopolyspora sp. MS10 TaxID=3385973 RepID=UPI00399EF21C
MTDPHRTRIRRCARNHDQEDSTRMLLPEDLSRIRHRELVAEARQDRLAHQVTAARWWRRVARYAQQRADRSEEAITGP